MSALESIARGRTGAPSPRPAPRAPLTAAELNARTWTAEQYDRTIAALHRMGHVGRMSDIGEARAREDPQLFEVWAGPIVREATIAAVDAGKLSKASAARVFGFWTQLGSEAAARELAAELRGGTAPGTSAEADRARIVADARAEHDRARILASSRAERGISGTPGALSPAFQAHAGGTWTPAALAARAAQLGVSADEYAAAMGRR